MTSERFSPRLTEACVHLVRNTEFKVLLEHMRNEHRKYWLAHFRAISKEPSEFARGEAYAIAELYKRVTGQEIIDAPVLLEFG